MLSKASRGVGFALWLCALGGGEAESKDAGERFRCRAKSECGTVDGTSEEDRSPRKGMENKMITGRWVNTYGHARTFLEEGVVGDEEFLHAPSKKKKKVSGP